MLAPAWCAAMSRRTDSEPTRGCPGAAEAGRDHQGALIAVPGVSSPLPCRRWPGRGRVIAG